MKRFTTIFLLITFFFVITSSLLAQTITIGTGTSTQRYPLDVWYGYGRSAAIYTAAEVTLAGTITKLAWYPTASISVDHPIKIYLKEVTTSTLVADTWANMISGATMVYDATIPGTTANVWNEFSLSTSFEYNGTDNLLVLVETNYGGSGSGTGSTGSAVRYSTATSQHQYWQTDNAPSTSNGTVTSNRPNIQITLVTGPMVYTSSTTTQNTIPVIRGTNDQWIIGIQVVTTGTQSPIPLTQFNLNTNGTTNTTDISNAKIYYTGTSNVFAATNQFGSTVASPNGSYNITDTRTLSVGTNYFWLTYDIPSGATAGNFVDAECVQITVDGSTYVPTITAPSGAREIKIPLSGTYIIGPGGYTTFGAAVADLNLVGISGPVSFNVTAGQVFTDSIIITATGTASNTITFQKSGGGANPIIQRSGTTATTDAIIMLNGSDYITFDGIDLQPVSGSTAVERGYYLAGASATNGCKNNTIKNCVITLDKANTSSRGIFLSSSATDTAGANANNKFYNNTVQNCYNGYYLSGNSSVYDDGNEIGITGGGTSLIDNIGGSSSTVYGIYYLYQTGLKIFSTTLSNVSGTLTTVYGIYGSGTNNTVDMYSNTISNISNTSSSSSIYGLYITSGLTHNFYSNTVRSCTSAANVYGVYISASSSTNNIYKNSVYDINYSGTSSSYAAYGMYFSSGTSHNIYNNMIYDLRGVGATNTTVGVTGLYLTGGTNVNVFYNSVLLNYVSTSSANRSAAIYASTSPTNIDLRNNIFVNNVDVATGTHAVAFRRSSTGFTNIASTTNNNLYYAGAPGTKNLIFYDGTNSDQTLAAYKARIATRDQSAVTENPPFMSTSAPYDLHLNPSIPTQCEKGAVPVTTPFAVADDFDGDARNASTPDIGADEGSFTVLDISSPSILYTVLTNTSSTSNRILSANIVDGSGVPTSGSLVPRIYYKKSSTGTYYSQPGTLASGSGQNGIWNFTINNSDMGGVAGGDTVYYFVIAQDIVSTPNIGSNPGGVVASDVNNITTYPALNSYRIIGTISGSFNVGSGQTYETITAAINDLNNKEIVGAVVFNLMDASYPTETYPIKINTNPGSSASNTVIIKPASGVTASVSGSSTTAIFQLNGATYVTIDGSNNGTNSRNLSISNTSTSSSTAVIWLSSLGTGAGAKNNTIKNCNIAAGSNSVTSTFGIFVGGTSISTTGTGADNDDLTIQNNSITKCYYAVFARGVATTGELNDLLITQNSIGSETAADYVTYRGIDVQNASAPTISQNTIFNLQLSTSVNNAAIDLGQNVSDAVVSRNKIYGLRSTSTSGYGSYGINISSGTNTTNISIQNNVIYDIITSNYSATSTTYNAFGIRITGGTNHKVYYNSINLFGPVTGGTAAGMSAAFLVSSNTATGVDVRNNIFANSTQFAITGAKSYSAYVVSGTTFGTINYNDYYASGTYGILGYYGADKTTLVDWQASSNGDSNSIAADPLFFGPTALQPYIGSPVLSAGTSIPGVTVDFLGVTRGTPPSIGAYEEGIPVGPPNCATIVSPPDAGTNIIVQATLNWANGGGGPTGYKLWFGTDNPPTNIVNGADLGNVLTYDPPGNMTYNTTYYWKIVPYNGMGDASGCAVWSFTTAPDPTIVAFPYTQNFDGVTAPELPYGWSKIVNSSSSSAKVETYTSGTPYSTPNHIYNYNSGDASATLLLISPPTATLNDKRIKFMAKGSSGYTLIFGTMSDPTNAATFTTFSTINLTSTYTQYMVELNTYSGSDQYIAFKHGLGGTYRAIYIDDFVMELILENDISAKTIDDPTSGSYKVANVAFTPNATFMNNGTLTQTSIPVRFKIFDKTSALVYTNDQTISSLAPGISQQVTFSNYTPTDTGTYTARAICVNPGDGNGTNDSITISFTVIPSMTTMFEDFSTYTGSAPPPIYWNEGDQKDILDGGTFGAFSNGSWVQDGFGNVGTTGSARFNYYGTSSDDHDWIITPYLNIQSASRLKFDIALTLFNTTTPTTMDVNDTMFVVVSTDGGNTFPRANVVASYHAGTPISNTGQTEFIPLSAFAGQFNVRIGFYAKDLTGSPDYDFFIDNVELELLVPNDIAAKSITNPVAGSGKPMNIAFGPKAIFKNSGTTAQSSIPVRFKIFDPSSAEVYTNNQTISSLSPNAEIEVTFANFTPTVSGIHTARAIALNPGDQNGMNDSITVTFNAIPSVSTFPHFEDFEGAAAGWRSAILNGTANDWILGTPAKTHIAGPYSGTKCWVTKDTGSYTASQNSYVISPIFNVSSLTGDVAVEFYHNFKTENNFDAGILEYSIDGGAIWRRADSTVGTTPNWNTELSTNWYNNSSTNGPITPRKWADTSSMYQGHLNGWIKSTTVLLGTAEQPNLQLRWRFGCDGSVQKEGWAFDNVTVKEREPFLTVTAPNGGEWLLIGSQQTISWNSFGVSTVDIEYSTNNGTSWISIASGVPSKSNAESMDAVEKVVLKNNPEGTYLWTIPNTPSSNCKVRVTSATNPLLTDMSDNTFTIATVLPPGWAVRTNAPDAISRPLAAYAKIDDIGYVYIMGGGTPVTTNRKYNTSTNTWTSGTAMLNGAMTSSAAPVKGIIFAIGGTDTTANIGKVQIYDPKTDSWSYGINLPGRQRDIGVAVWRDSLIYVFGGDDGLFPYAPAVSPVTNDVRFYNPSTNAWTTATSLPIAYAKMGAAICGNTIILAGGWTGGDAVANCYKGIIDPANPANITWTAIPNYPAGTIVRVAGAYLSNAGNGVIFTGGLIGGNTQTGNTYFFDITANTWSTLPSMPTARGNMSSRLATNGVDSMWAVCGYSSVALSNNERFSYPSVTTGTTISVNLNAGWNMISNPVTTSSDSVKQLYPTSLFDYVFSFAPGTGYVQSKRILNGPGYWGKFPAAGSATITGGPRTLDSISVVAGWNMVGTISYQIDTSTITSNPLGLKASNWFGYETGYNPAKFLVPGKAYWIKSHATGKFIFQGSGELSKPSENISELDQFNSITLTDANGSAQTLYFGSEVEGINTAMYEMPPTPPSDAFDARFEGIDGGYMLKTHSVDIIKAASFTISIQSMAYPLIVTWDVNSDQHAYELNYGDANTKQTLIGEGQLTINDEDISQLFLMAKSGEELPAEFALMQNYPNPFNPVTNIKFALPEPSKVAIEIYNVLGQKVRTLISEERVAGYHVIEWNGKNDVNQFTGSGVYYLKINADGSSGKNFTQIRKMILLR